MRHFFGAAEARVPYMNGKEIAPTNLRQSLLLLDRHYYLPLRRRRRWEPFVLVRSWGGSGYRVGGVEPDEMLCCVRQHRLSKGTEISGRDDVKLAAVMH